MFKQCVVIICFMMAKVINCAVEKLEPRFVPPPPPFAPPLLYPVNAATGILVAIAIPIPLHEQSVFVSYNFEANYNMPNVAPDSFPGKINRWTHQDPNPFPQLYGDPASGGEATVDDIIARKLESDSTKLNVTANDSIDEHALVKRSSVEREIFTRRGAYHVIESRLNSSGINGKKCLLLAICESSNVSFMDHNGVIGNVLHIILTPSSSLDEKLPTEYMKAESRGKSKDCKKYQKQCNFNVLDVFSKII